MFGRSSSRTPLNDLPPVATTSTSWRVRKTATSPTPNRPTPATAAAGRCPPRGSTRRSSDRSTPSSMITKRNSTTMPNSVATSDKAECTGLPARTTPTAPARMIAAATTNTMTVTTAAVPPSLWRSGGMWRFGAVWTPKRHSLGADAAARASVGRSGGMAVGVDVVVFGLRGDALGDAGLDGRGGDGLRDVAHLAVLGRSDPEGEPAGPRDRVLVHSAAGRRRRPHPGRRVREHRLGVAPVLPREHLRLAVVADEQLVAGVDGVLAVGERELEQLRLGDGLRRARLDAQVAVDATQVVDLVDEAVALARRHGIVGRVVGAANVDAAGRAHARAQLAPDALLHAVLVAVEDMAPVHALGLGPLGLRVLDGDGVAGLGAVEQLAEGDLEPVEIAHQVRTSAWWRSAPMRMAAASSVPTARRARPHTGTTMSGSQSRSLPIRSAAISSSQPSANGISSFQPRSMSWSYRKRGRVARNHTNTNRKIISLAKNQISGHTQSGPNSVGPLGPPRNSVTMMADIVIVFMNDAR